MQWVFHSKTKFKKTLAVKKRLKRDLIHKYTEEEWFKYNEHFLYNPSCKFIYSHLIIRSYKDELFPNFSEDQSVFSWMKGEIWDFYENGLEFIYQLSNNIIIEEDETWYLTEEYSDKVSKGSCVFMRIPYEYIVSYEMETDGYYGYPTLYVECANNGSPFEETIYGLIGYYNREEVTKSRMTYYLDKNKQIIIE